MKLTKYFVLMNLTMFILAALMTMKFSMMKKDLLVEWKLFSMESINLEMLIFVDFKSMAFFSSVLLITLAIILYSQFYMESSNKKTQFMKMIILFVTSMSILIFSPNMITMIMGWEGLGMTSFVLIMFYQNKKSVMSAMYTMIMNRLGDIMILISMFNMMNLSSWMFYSPIFEKKELIMSFLLIGAFSKSAQIPFSSWLTEAMAAPTPVSALVHSSTLVTAGIYLIIRFELTMKFYKMSKIIMFVSLLTLMMASINSLYEWDIKKLVALSTLSQLSTMFMVISMNLFSLALFHVMMHAMFKALIFLCASSLISFSNTQDIRQMMGMNTMMFTLMSLNSASMALCGLPFMSGFYSKDLIMEMASMQNKTWMFNLIFYWAMSTTMIYSMKTSILISTKNSKMKHKKLKESNMQISSKMLLLVASIILGNKLNWILNINYNIAQIDFKQKILPILMMMMFIITMEKFMNNKKKTSIKINSTKMFKNYMWFLKSLGFKIKNTTLMFYFLMFKNSEKGILTKNNMMMMKTTLSISNIWFVLTHKKFSTINILILIMLIAVI
uniref:NADH dehydrogenase subunit 5 n=1 Tax=Pealius machili TaxID=2829201 RepID=UPI001BF08EA6|nr:NADH dehydrogenase subunit 5 [Pealius machili]QUA05860.1 NADH dehydrogenase subunit 5 [Pealius machili]